MYSSPPSLRNLPIFFWGREASVHRLRFFKRISKEAIATIIYEWEKLLLPPSHGWVVFNTNSCEFEIFVECFPYSFRAGRLLEEFQWQRKWNKRVPFPLRTTAHSPLPYLLHETPQMEVKLQHCLQYSNKITALHLNKRRIIGNNKNLIENIRYEAWAVSDTAWRIFY